MNLLEENYNDIKQIKEVINEIKYNQQKTIQIVEKNHKTNMKKIEKLQEFNEINDMTNTVFEERLLRIEKLLDDIYSKIA
ncbi:MAG: hypothetical protein U0O04_06575 [Clostridia bacterium]|jgi:hypothetical protein|nr:unknown [Clostridium sp. CAG:571]HJJ06884.1 hypothetical protein [Clostridiaceae bacterium]HJJ13606.1 hypothetical protein [Clostridiaceae bacterium]